MFPFEDDPVLNSLGVVVDREKCIKRVVSEDREDPRAKEEDMGRLYAQLAASRVSTLEEKYELGVDLEDEEESWFIHRCVCNDLVLCESTPQSSPNPRRLVKEKDPSGNSALSQGCMGGHPSIGSITRTRSQI